MKILSAFVWILLCSVTVVNTQPPARQIEQERKQAEADVPKFVEVLELEPGMTVADVGAGFGAMAIVMAKWIGPAGRIFATDIAATQIATIRDYVKRAGLDNVTVLEGAPSSTNLPPDCCDSIFLCDVYHHVTQPEGFNASLLASLKPGGRLAVIDFVARPGSQLFPGVNPNRGGHGIPPAVLVSEVSAVGLTHVKTVNHWPDDQSGLFLALFRK